MTGHQHAFDSVSVVAINTKEQVDFEACMGEGHIRQCGKQSTAVTGVSSRISPLRYEIRYFVTCFTFSPLGQETFKQFRLRFAAACLHFVLPKYRSHQFL